MEIDTLVEMKLVIEGEFYKQLIWLCDRINEKNPEMVAGALLQVAIENTVSDPVQIKEWLDAFSET